MILDKNAIRKLGTGLAATTEMLVYALSGYAVGYFLDHWIESTKPWLTVLFTLLGLTGGFYRLYKVMVRYVDGDRNNKE